jgi:hypothetical protein
MLVHKNQCTNRERERRRGESPGTERGRRGARPPATVVGEGEEERRIAWNREEPGQAARRGKGSLASGAGKERFFKNRLWAHQTVYSACPVHTGQHTVAVRWSSTIADLCAPSRCTGHCTVQCPVHTGLSGEPRQREF